MAEAFVKTFKRDYVRITALPGADTALAPIENWMEDYNTVHPHSRLATIHPASTSLPNRTPLCVRSDRVNSTSVRCCYPEAMSFLATTGGISSAR